ncbi:MAG: diadenylate cyclase CdaA [Oscillospiraceae bacterium]
MEQIVQVLQNAKSYIKLMGISDFVDIAIMAYVIYRILLLIRRSRSGQVAKAIVIIVAALGIATAFNLNMISFLLSRAVELGLIALLIIFQPELRRLLEQVGSGKLTGVFTREQAPEEMENAIIQTVAAYAAFSKDKVGALMVFERKTLLDDVLKTGTAIDATASAELLKNLFWNKAPMHDGAVIVRGGRVAGAGCMLPLSTNVNLSRDLGMRHRAGIGISENSDAVVAIVSEETGSISVAVGGMLKRHLAPETLERLLRKELLPEETPKSGHIDLRNALSGLFKFKSKKGDKADGQKNP